MFPKIHFNIFCCTFRIPPYSFFYPTPILYPPTPIKSIVSHLDSFGGYSRAYSRPYNCPHINHPAGFYINIYFSAVHCQKNSISFN